jgi:hypothetical protein
VLPKADSLFGDLTEPLLVDGIPAEAANFAHTETSKAISSERKRVPAAQPSGDEEIEVPGRTRLLAKTRRGSLPSEVFFSRFPLVAQ